MITDNEINEELSKMTSLQLFDRLSNILAMVGAINPETGKPPTADELIARFHKKKIVNDKSLLL